MSGEVTLDKIAPENGGKAHDCYKCKYMRRMTNGLFECEKNFPKECGWKLSQEECLEMLHKIKEQRQECSFKNNKSEISDAYTKMLEERNKILSDRVWIIEKAERKAFQKGLALGSAAMWTAYIIVHLIGGML